MILGRNVNYDMKDCRIQDNSMSKVQVTILKIMPCPGHNFTIFMTLGRNVHYAM